MAEMSLFTQLLTQMAGGGAAAYVDQAKPEWTKHVGASATSPGVAITPGAMGSLGLAVFLAFMPSKGGSTPMWKTVLANMAGGGLTYEGARLLVDEVIPRIKKAASPKTPLPAGVPPAVTGIPYYGAMGQGGFNPQVHEYELRQAMQQFRRAA